MSDDVETGSSLAHSDEPSSEADAELGSLLRRAFAEDQQEVDVLRGVQERLRKESGGKFYGDGWSRTRHPPFSTFFITSLMMLAVVLVIYAVLVPVVGVPVELPSDPAPVQVLPPREL